MNQNISLIFLQSLLKAFLNFPYISFLKAFWPLLLIIVLISAYRQVKYIYREVKYIIYKRKLTEAGMPEIDHMSGPSFEIFLKSLFEKLGYKVEHTGQSGDFGVDLILEMGGLRIATQAKRYGYKHKVGEDAIREAYSVMNLRKCKLGMVVTNSFYSDKAKILAKSNNITLWDRNDLIANILKTKNH